MFKSAIKTFPRELITLYDFFGTLPVRVSCPHLEQMVQNDLSDLKTAHLIGAIPPTILMVWGIFSPSYMMMSSYY